MNGILHAHSCCFHIYIFFRLTLSIGNYNITEYFAYAYAMEFNA